MDMLVIKLYTMYSMVTIIYTQIYLYIYCIIYLHIYIWKKVVLDTLFITQEGLKIGGAYNQETDF